MMEAFITYAKENNIQVNEIEKGIYEFTPEIVFPDINLAIKSLGSNKMIYHLVRVGDIYLTLVKYIFIDINDYIVNEYLKQLPCGHIGDGDSYFNMFHATNTKQIEKLRMFE